MLVFSTHAFTEGDVAVGVGVGMAAISTHAFTEGDYKAFTADVVDLAFQLTPSRKATEEEVERIYYSDISTHAFTEGDAIAVLVLPHPISFQLTPSRKATANSNNFCC